jgi:hypothetical protein
MADIVVTAAKVGVVFPGIAEIYDAVAAEAITAGQPVAFTTAGKVQVCDANVAGRNVLHGIAVMAAGAGQAVSILKRGHLFGFTLAGAYGSKAYVSDTLGVLADAAGTASLPVGQVVPLSDAAKTKVLYVDINWA